MYARKVSVHLKPNMITEYGHVFDTQVLPLLRKQAGFKDELTLANANGLDVTAISLWENKRDAENYDTKTYPEVLKICSKLIDGTPKVQTSEVVNSTFHKITAHSPVPA